LSNRGWTFPAGTQGYRREIRTGQGRPQAQTPTDSGTGCELTEAQVGGDSSDHADRTIPARPATPGSACTDPCPHNNRSAPRRATDGNVAAHELDGPPVAAPRGVCEEYQSSAIGVTHLRGAMRRDQGWRPTCGRRRSRCGMPIGRCGRRCGASWITLLERSRTPGTSRYNPSARSDP